MARKDIMKNILLKAGFSSNTIDSYLFWINKYIDYTKNNNKSLTGGLYTFINDCKTQYSIPTQKVILSSLQVLINNIDKNTMFDYKFPRSQWVVKTSLVTKEQYQNWQDNLIHNDEYISIRNRNIIKVLWNTGVRISELINLKWDHISNSTIWIRSKNNKERLIPFRTDLFNELEGIKNSEFVFSTKNGGKLTYSSMYKLINEISNGKLSPHSFRHSFATRLLKNGVPLNYVSKLLGHSNLNTTLIYLHTTMDDIRQELSKKDWQ